jgi:hypothetical protein
MLVVGPARDRRSLLSVPGTAPVFLSVLGVHSVYDPISLCCMWVPFPCPMTGS